MKAIRNGNIDLFNSFINDGLDIFYVTESEKWNYLHRSIDMIRRKPDPRIIERFIKLGVDINAKDCYGNTPLQYAARSKDVDSARLLLIAGAEVDSSNIDGITPLRHCLLQGSTNFELVELFLSNGADVNHCVEGGATVKEYIEAIAHGKDAPLLDLLKKYQD